MPKVVPEAQSPFAKKRRPHWVGWYRMPGRRWRQVCTAPTERECWAALEVYRDARSVESERCVTRANEEPP